MLTTIPEVIFFNTIKSLLKALKEDYNNKLEETDTILYNLLEDQQLQRYGFLEQAKEVFLKNDDDPRKIEVDMVFNRNRRGAPTIHITLPNEEEQFQTIGRSEGHEEIELNNGNTKKIKIGRVKARYSIVITSDNVNEVILIYHVLRSLMLGVHDHFAVLCLENIKFSGTGLEAMESSTHNLYVKMLNIDFEYMVSGIDFREDPFISNAIFCGTPKLEE